MNSVWNWLKSHKKTIASVACGVAAVAIAPASPIAAVAVAGVCSALGVSAGKEYEAGKWLGTNVINPALEKIKK